MPKEEPNEMPKGIYSVERGKWQTLEAMSKEEKTKKMDIHAVTDGEHYDKALALKEQRGFQNWGELFENLLDGTPFLPSELLKEVDSFFMEGNHIEKLRFIVQRFKEWSETFPYLNSQGREITPEDANFPPCPYQKAVVWEGKFLGFQCQSIKPLAVRLFIQRFPTKIGSVSFPVTTPEDCLKCMELRKQVGIGIALKGVLTLEELQSFKKKMMDRKERESLQPEREMTCKLEKAGVRNPQEAKELLKYVRYDNEKQKWKNKSKASRELGISRPTIDKILKALPKGID